MAFDITSVLKGSGIGAGQEQITYLPLDQIDPDPNNFYSLDHLGELADNIATIGLQQPLRVRPGTEPGRYTIVSGHRRRAACLLIRDGEDEARTMFDNGVACIVETGEASEALQELRLIYANAATRVMTSAEMSIQAERVEMLLYQLKEEGMSFPGRMRDHVAEACKVSKSKLARLHAIRKRLDPKLLQFFDRGELSEEAAYQLSRLPAEIQDEAGQRLADGRVKRIPTAYVVEKVAKNLDRYQAEMPCRSHAGGPDCHWKNEKILRSIFRQYEWHVCEPGQCCRDCYHWKDCSGACQETKDRRKLEKAVEKEKQDEQKAAEAKQQERYKSARMRELKRLLPLIEAKGLGDDANLPGLRNWLSQPGPKVEAVRKMAAGDFGTAHFYDEHWLPTDVDTLTKWADFFGCSLDYLAGRTKKPEPAAVSVPGTGVQWQTGTPTEAGDYVMRAGVPKTETPGSWITTIKRWDGEEWKDSQGVPLRLTVYRWIKLPEV